MSATTSAASISITGKVTRIIVDLVAAPTSFSFILSPDKGPAVNPLIDLSTLGGQQAASLIKLALQGQQHITIGYWDDKKRTFVTLSLPA